MEPTYYEIGVIASIPDQEFTSSLNGVVLNMRLFFATTTELWWLEISNADRTVTLSQICLRPGVWHGLSGKLPGYAGAGAIGVARLRPNEKSGSDLLNHFRLKSWVFCWLWWWGSRWVRLSFGTGLNIGWELLRRLLRCFLLMNGQ